MNKSTIQSEFIKIQRRHPQCDSVSDLDHQDFYKKLLDVDHQTIAVSFLSLISKSNDPDYFYWDQKMSARYLWVLKPKAEIELIDTVRLITPSLNASIGELSFYFMFNFGYEYFINTLLNYAPENDEIKKTISFLLYWSGEEFGPTRRMINDQCSVQFNITLKD